METEELEVMKSIENGATIWGMGDAKAIQELQKKHPGWLTIISNLKELEEITGESYDGAKKCPYFGAILTAEGKEALKSS